MGIAVAVYLLLGPALGKETASWGCILAAVSEDDQRAMLMKEQRDGLDEYHREANGILTQRAAESNNLVQEKYIRRTDAEPMNL